jgi:hypothetical protein
MWSRSWNCGRDAAEADFEGPSQAARAAGATAEEQERIDYAKRLAL